jgi:hypothetical protein
VVLTLLRSRTLVPVQTPTIVDVAPAPCPPVNGVLHLDLDGGS